MLRAVFPALLAAVAIIPAATAAATSGLCARWSAPAVLGQLDISQLPEASGIGLAAQAELLYHNNDGREPHFLVTRRDGSGTRRVAVTGFDAVDIEDLALGRCGQKSCLYLADVGDNGSRRESVQIAVIEEQQQYEASVNPRAVVTARFPDGPHNAEAVALHPSGDLFLVTKAGNGAGQAGPARLYRLSAAQLAAGGTQTFEPRGEIPVPALIGRGIGPRHVVTAMDIAPDGGRFVLLAYDFLLEIAVDPTGPLPSASGWIAGRTHQVAPIAQLIQAEAIAYDRDGRSVLYSSESVLGSGAPVMQQRCEE